MPLSASPSPPLSPPPPIHAAGPSTSSKGSNDTDDEPQFIDRPSGSGSSRIKAEANGGDDEDAVRTEKQAAEAKERYDADMKLHAYEAPRADRPQDDWQVAYVWAFIVKFNLRDRIKRLECLEDFEQSLMEPVANRPDDILEGILIRFLHNLKPGLRGLDPGNVQQHLLNYITEQLLGPSEFTVWDRPWAPNEEARGSCCNTQPDRTELGRLRYVGEPAHERVERNPLWRAKQKGGGIFELDWRERAGMLRQLVDWQLTHSDPIRAIINKENHVNVPKGVTIPEAQGLVKIEPIGMDRNKQRIWMLDNSGRIYKSGNPFKRPCPIFAISSNKTEMQEQIDKWTEHGNTPKAGPAAGGSKGKGKAEMAAARKAAKGIEDEKKLAEVAAERMELVEKEDARIARARKKLADSFKIYEQAEFRSTRTRRTTKKIDYSYGDDEGGDEDDYEQPRRSSRRGEPAAAAPSRPIIPGERKSARLTRGQVDDGASASYNEGTHGDGRSSSVEMDEDSRAASPRKRGNGYGDEEMNGRGGGGGSKKRRLNGGGGDSGEGSSEDEDFKMEANGGGSEEGMGHIDGIEVL